MLPTRDNLLAWFRLGSDYGGDEMTCNTNNIQNENTGFSQQYTGMPVKPNGTSAD